MSNSWTYSSKLCFLKKLPQFFLSGSCVWGSWIYLPLDQRSKTTSHQKDKRTDCNKSNCVPFVVLGLSTSSSTTPTPTSSSSSSQDSPFDVSRYTENLATERSWSMSEDLRETCSINQQKPKKMKDAKKYKAIYCMNWVIGYRSSEKIWSMKVVLQSHGETLRLRIKTLPVLLMNSQWSREQKWNRTRARIVSTSTFGGTQIAISAWRQK